MLCTFRRGASAHALLASPAPSSDGGVDLIAAQSTPLPSSPDQDSGHFVIPDGSVNPSSIPDVRGVIITDYESDVDPLVAAVATQGQVTDGGLTRSLPLLATALVQVAGADGGVVVARALVDPASQINLISTSLISLLQVSAHPARGAIGLAASQRAYVRGLSRSSFIPLPVFSLGALMPV